MEEEGTPFSRIAVLFRASHHSQALEVELARHGIRYDYRGGLRFFERAHVKDVLAYLRILHNPKDVAAWSRVLHLQVGIGSAVAGKILSAIQEALRPYPDPPLLGEGNLNKINKNNLPPSLDFARDRLRGESEWGLSEGKREKKVSLRAEDLEHIGTLLPTRAQIGWQNFLRIFSPLLHLPPLPSHLITSVLQSNYREHSEAEYPAARHRIRDLEQLARMSEREESLRALLSEASLSERFAHDDKGNEIDRVVLSTIHQAKGLEWAVVFVIHLVDGQFPHERALKETDGIEEERRLFYVAITRAEQFLYLTYPMMDSRNTMFPGPSPFLQEINAKLLQGDALESLDSTVYVMEDEPFPTRPKRASFLKSVDEL